MTDLETFESLCPDVAPLSAHERAAMRRDLFGNESPVGASPVGSADQPTCATTDSDGATPRTVLTDRGTVRFCV